MRIITALLIASFSVAAQAGPDYQKWNQAPKIVGGEEAREGEYPFMVSLQSSSHFCGGTLIQKNWIMTAAHCVKGGTVKKILVGLYSQKNPTGAESFKPAKIIAHPKYNSSTMDYDYALIQLDHDSSMPPVLLNDQEISLDAETITSTTTGWGLTSESGSAIADKLRKVDVPLVSESACNSSASYNGDITDRMLCAGLPTGGKDSCQGDSGGPLLVKDQSGNIYLAGIVSWGEGCARPKKYGVYSKVNAVIDWINNETK